MPIAINPGPTPAPLPTITPTDLAVAVALEPPLPGVPCGPGCAPLPADWLAQAKSGKPPPGCSGPWLDADGVLHVSSATMTLLASPTAVTAAGVDPTAASTLLTTINAQTAASTTAP